MSRGVTMLLAFMIGAPVLVPGYGAEVPVSDLLDLSLEELTNLRITSVSRQPERLADAAASIYVITNEDIRRSGATGIAEALRLAPNLQVARIDSAQYAISARGFNNAVGNKLLVLIDGRTVYTPLFSGVFWDQQDVLLADVDRIEVISGPGATLWGANAVNGVINIITRPAGDTQGTFVSVGGGNIEQAAAVRYGSTLGGSGHFRVYAKTTQVDNTELAGGEPLPNAWNQSQLGFRADWSQGDDLFTLQGDVYDGRSEDRGAVGTIQLGRVAVAGVNLLGHWSRQLTSGGELRVQAYATHSEREDRVLFQPDAEIFDIEIQHAIPLTSHNILWGGGYRRGEDVVEPGFFATFIPGSSELEWANLFLQDRIQVADGLDVTLGVKLESNDYTGTESLPSMRLAWKPSEERLVWAAVSRAVRAPSRLDREVFFPETPPFVVVGGPNFQSEVAKVVELGYRAQATDDLSYSVTAFHHDWDKLRSGSSVPVTLENKIEGDASGIEAWATWQVSPAWRLSAGLGTLDLDLRLEPDSTDPVGVGNPTLANDPDYHWSVRSSLDLPYDMALDVNVRHVADLPNPAVPDYTAVDARISWSPRPTLTVVATARNLLDSEHPEFGDPANGSVLPRSIFLEVLLRLGP
jgi:iron complex outermembrane receptor protein